MIQSRQTNLGTPTRGRPSGPRINANKGGLSCECQFKRRLSHVLPVQAANRECNNRLQLVDRQTWPSPYSLSLQGTAFFLLFPKPCHLLPVPLLRHTV